MKSLRLLVVLLLFAPLSGCDSFLDINRDPDAADAAPGGLLFTTVTANLGSNRAIEILGGNFHGQAWSSGLSTSVLITSERYDISPFTTGNTWSNYYTTGIKNLFILINQAEAAEPVLINEAAQARMMMAFIFFNLTLIWEDVPFSDAGRLLVDPDNPDFQQPRFDSQRDILYGVIDIVNEGIAQIDLGDPSPPIGPGDVVYAGNMANWKRFGNSLKLNAYMYLRGGGESVGAEIEALIANPDLIRVNTQNAYIPFGGTTPSPRWNLAGLFSGGVWLWTYGSEAMVNLMNERMDPRRPVYLYPNNAGNFVGVTPGAAGSAANHSQVHGGRVIGGVLTDGNMIRANAPEVLMSADQVLFLEAEYLASTGQLGAADEKYREALRQNFNMLGAQFGPVPNQIIGEDDDGNPIEQTPTQWINARPNLADMSQQNAVYEIQEQHWVSLFGRATEVWSHVRRVGDDVPGINRTLPIGADVSNFLNRLPYPPGEVTANPNVPSPEPSRTAPMWFQGGN